jgi:hypothetical protein
LKKRKAGGYSFSGGGDLLLLLLLLVSLGDIDVAGFGAHRDLRRWVQEHWKGGRRRFWCGATTVGALENPGFFLLGGCCDAALW